MPDDFGTVIGVAFFLLCMAYAAHIEWTGYRYRRRAEREQREAERREVERCTACGRELARTIHGDLECKPCDRLWSQFYPPSYLERHAKYQR